MLWNQILATRNEKLKPSEIRELFKLIAQPDVISMAGGIPDPSLFPRKAFREAFHDILSDDQQSDALQYSSSEGDLKLRQWISGQMAKLQIPCGPENIIITSGSQQALDYLGKMFLSPGDGALVQWPTYLGAISAFNAYEPEFRRLSFRGDEIQENLGSSERKGTRPKIAYLSADFANPTGETLSRAARLNLLDFAEKNRIAIIEDAAYQFLRYEGDHIPPILALDVERVGDINAARTLYCGSFSKTLSPGLRVGWICAAQSIILKLVLMKQAADLHSGVINQMAVARVAEEGFSDHVGKIRPVYRSRCQHMLDILAEEMPAGVQWTQPQGGMFIWLTLPEHIDATKLLARSLETEKVAFIPGGPFFADGSQTHHLRLSFANVDEDKISDGVRRLGVVLREAIAKSRDLELQ